MPRQIRSAAAKVLVAATCLAFTTACADLHPPQQATVVLPSGDVVDLSGDGVDTVITVAYDVTTSTRAERPDQLRRLADLVGQEAVQRRALVLVIALNEQTATHVVTLGRETFAFSNDNPVEIDDLKAAATARLVAAVARNAGTTVETRRSDPIGFLAIAGTMFAQVPEPGLAVIIGDGISTTERCNAHTLFGPDGPVRPLAGLAETCVGGRFPDLRGADVMVLGAGVDVDEPLPDYVANGSHDLLAEVVNRSGGGHLHWRPVTIPGAPH